MPDHLRGKRSVPTSPLGTPLAPGPRPFDYIWHGTRVSHYVNHGNTWQGCPATERNHYTLTARPLGYVEAWSDGRHDDTSAIQAALDAQVPVRRRSHDDPWGDKETR